MKMKQEHYKKNVGVNLIIFSYRRYWTTQKISRYDKKFQRNPKYIIFHESNLSLFN